MSDPFRGSRAVAAGAVTAHALRTARYRRLFPDVYVAAGCSPDLAVRSRAAYLLVEGRGVLAGYSAAELLDASCGPTDAAATVLMLPGRQRRSRPGLVVRRDVLLPGEIGRHRGLVLTTPVRTAFDLARWAPTLTEKVVAVDALSYAHNVSADAVRAVAWQHVGAAGSKMLPTVLRLVDGRSESPMETRIRVALVLAGLPPAVQYPVVGAGRHMRLDLAYPDVMLAIEYDGADHRLQARARRDLEREAALTRLGWTVLRFDAPTVLRHPQRLVAVVRSELDRRRSALSAGKSR